MLVYIANLCCLCLKPAASFRWAGVFFCICICKWCKTLIIVRREWCAKIRCTPDRWIGYESLHNFPHHYPHIIWLVSRRRHVMSHSSPLAVQRVKGVFCAGARWCRFHVDNSELSALNDIRAVWDFAWVRSVSWFIDMRVDTRIYEDAAVDMCAYTFTILFAFFLSCLMLIVSWWLI